MSATKPEPIPHQHYGIRGGLAALVTLAVHIGLCVAVLGVPFIDITIIYVAPIALMFTAVAKASKPLTDGFTAFYGFAALFSLSTVCMIMGESADNELASTALVAILAVLGCVAGSTATWFAGRGMATVIDRLNVDRRAGNEKRRR